MAFEYNDKGKFFTDVVSKEAVQARIQTTTHYLEGDIHVRPGCRIKDELDMQEAFLAVTNAQVFRPSGEPAFKTKFIAVRRDQIVWITTNKDVEE
jgi:hypothetical protein